MCAIDAEQATDIRALREILEDAAQRGAEAVELEYVFEGLEVTWISGNLGFGIVLTDRELIRDVMGAIVEQAGLDEKPTGKIRIDLFGKPHIVAVEEYESFGETCFRLVLDRASV